MFVPHRPMLATCLGLAMLPAPIVGQAAFAQPDVTFSGTSANDKPPALAAAHDPVPQNAPDMQAVLDALQSLGGKPIESLTPAEARKQPTPADAAHMVMSQKAPAAPPDLSVATRDLSYGSNEKEIARLYSPVEADGKGPMPVVVYYHGGGWVIADLSTYDATPRLLAKQLNALVVSVEYRHAPEYKFPAQHDDAAAAYGWVVKNAASWGGDPARIALAGESAGGNLAIATAIYARDHKLQAPVSILSVYPIANSDAALPSKKESGATKPLNTTMLGWFSFYYSTSTADMKDPRVNLVAADLRNLPPTTIVNAQNDPLRSDGETLSEAMKKAGDSVEQRTFPGVTHEFFGMGAVVGGAKEAEDYAIGRLQPALSASASHS
jgi:acetyl esterase/lipase